MKKFCYVVYSNINKNVMCEFFGRGSKQKSIKYAKSLNDNSVCVDRIFVDINTGEIFSIENNIWRIK